MSQLNYTFRVVSAAMIFGLFSYSMCYSQGHEAEKFWNNFRGPDGNGLSKTATPPTQWSGSENVVWKVEVPGRGSSSPIVWGNNVFVTTAISTGSANGAPTPRLNRRQIFEKFDEDGDGQLSGSERKKATDHMRAEKQKTLKAHKFVVLCIDRNDGKILWERTANETKPIDGHHQDSGYASASPITDGQHLFVNFGSYGLYCYDFEGKQIWSRDDLGEMEMRGSFGEGSSMALSGKFLVLPWDHEGQSYIETIDKTTGKTIWKKDRDEPSNWATPRVISVNGKRQIIHAGENYSRGYDLETGDEIWRSSGLSSRPVSSPVARGKIGYFASARRGAVLNAYHLDRTGDISEDAVWKIEQKTPDCPSLLLSENRLFYVSGNKGILSCANADDGSTFFNAKRLPEISGVYSSPIAANGSVFITGRNGKTVVIADSTDFKVLQQNDIGEPVDATLALVEDKIYIRGNKHLFCIGKK